MSCVEIGKQTTAYNSFDDRFPESPNVTVPEFSSEVTLILQIGFDGVFTQLLCRGEGWLVMNSQYRFHSNTESSLKLLR